MKITLYTQSIPALQKVLSNVQAILTKTAVHCENTKVDPSILLQSRLYPDMFPLLRQIQILTDITRRGCARLAGEEAPSYEDNEKTIEELQERLSKTIKYLTSLPAEAIANAEDRAIEFKARDTVMKFKGLDYLNDFVLPNAYFHASISYAILRHNGVTLGKADFLGS